MTILQGVRILALTTISFLTALSLTPFLVKLLYKLKFHKQIRSEKQAPVFYGLHKHKENTPTMGGIIIWLTVVIVAFAVLILAKVFDGFWGNMNFIDRAETYLPLAALLIAAILGLIDDLLGVLRIGPNGGGLRMMQKIVMYTIIASLGALWFYFRLDWDTLYIPFWGYIQIGWWYIPIFMFVIIASAFSTNETDGLDGLAGGTMLFAFGAVTVVAFAAGKFHLAAFGGTIIGALLAFLWFNIYPAKFFMGDTGSMSLGITLGVIAMLTNSVILLPFFAAIPVIESLSVIMQLISKKLFKKKIFISSPIHHHFEAIGWPESEITMRFWIISAVFSALGVALFFISKFLV